MQAEKKHGKKMVLQSYLKVHFDGVGKYVTNVFVVDMDEVSARLAGRTSEKLTNPFADMLMKGKLVDLDEDDDEFVAKNESKTGEEFLQMYLNERSTQLTILMFFIYYYSTQNCTATHYMSLGGFPWLCAGLGPKKSDQRARFSSVGLKVGVDCCIFNLSFTGDPNEVQYSVHLRVLVVV